MGGGARGVFVKIEDMKKCWASSLSGCGEKLTGEHIISSSILDKTIKVKGFSWCKDKPKEIGSSSFKNKILCEKHNSDLSKFDLAAKKFVSTIDAFSMKQESLRKFGFRKKDLPIIYKINGTKLERWCCKTLINICLTQKDEIIIHFDKILPAILKNINLEKPYGLSFAVVNGEKIDTNKFIEITPLLSKIHDDKKELAGGLFTFMGFSFILLLPCSKQSFFVNNELQLNENVQKEWIGRQLNWHNKNIYHKHQQSILQNIYFKW